MVSPAIISAYGNHVRVRVCGIAVESNSILLINHRGLNDQNKWWAPPGGGVEFGESLQQVLVREFKEETGLDVEVKSLLFVSEYIKDPLHAVEIFFEVGILGGELTIGFDPEMEDEQQSIKQVKYMTFEDLSIIPNEQKHQYLMGISNADQIINRNGYFTHQSKNIK